MTSHFAFTLLLLTSTFAMQSHAQNSRQDYIDSHNSARAELSLEPVTWDTTLEDYAKNYAEVRAADCALIHSKGPYGENIYYGTGPGFGTALDAVRWWYDEKPYYDYESNQCLDNKDCLHYTQMVWRDSTSIGCARVQCDNGWYFTTCNYYPPGNIEGQRPY